MPLGQIDKVQGTGVESDVEAFLYSLYCRGLFHLVVARVDCADSLGIVLLRCGYGSPKDSFAASSSIARQVSMATGYSGRA